MSYRSYDEYIEAQKPKHIHKCPRCGAEYYSDDGETWIDEHGAPYSHLPANGHACIACEMHEALSNPDHWATHEYLSNPKHVMAIVKEFLHGWNREYEAMFCLRLVKVLLADEEIGDDFRAAMQSYLEGPRCEIEAMIDDTFI